MRGSGNRAARNLLLLLVAIALSAIVPIGIGSAGPGDRRPYWVFLEEGSPSRSMATKPALSPRAVERLAKVGHIAGTDLRDHEIDLVSLAPLRERGVEIRNLSRWLRAASALLTQEQLESLWNDPRVRGLRPVARYVRPRGPIEEAESVESGIRRLAKAHDPLDVDPRTLTGADYGAAFEQLEMLGIPELHRRGYSGLGVRIAVLDTGFLKDHESLASLDLVAERDYVRGDGDVQYDSTDTLDTPQADSHGTYTWSAIGGFAPGRHIGTAYRASFVLAKTEDVTREVHLEEDNYVAALEWADSLGVDIVSSSLGYRYGFEDGIEEYGIEALNGDSLLISIATEIAADRGMLVITAMGNDGPAASTLNAPADGKKVLAVGAVDFWGGVMNFSSRGPTGDGRTKPDLLALGYQTSCASALDPTAYARVNGTSLSTPLITGLAALLLEEHPAWTPDSLIAVLHSSGDRSGDPDNTYGWGIPDGIDALGLDEARIRILGYDWAEQEDGDGRVAWGEIGEIRVWLRNDGGLASAAGTLVIADPDERIGVVESQPVSIPAIAPGDSLQSAPLGLFSIPVGEGEGQLTFFVRFSDALDDIDRKVYLQIHESPPPVVLASVFPNPVRAGSVSIEGSASPRAEARIEIFSIGGRRIREITVQDLDAPPASFLWDLEDEEGRPVATGIYFARQPGGNAHRICVVR